MTIERPNIGFCATDIASALHRAMKPANGHVTRVDIDCVRAATIGYLAAGGYVLPRHDTEQLIDLALRKFVEKCP